MRTISRVYPGFKKLTADKHVLDELPLVPFIIINLTRLTVFFFLAASRLSHGSLMRRKIKKNLWDQGIGGIAFLTRDYA